jgi:multidrug resistance efflux pump
MAPFAQTLESLRRDDHWTASLAGSLGLCVLVAWVVWLGHGSIRLIEVTESARLQTNGFAFALQAPVSGVVTRADLALDRAVVEGEVLVELDASPERLQRAEVQAQLLGIKPQLEQLRGELEVQERAGKAFESATRAAEEEALARLDEARLQARASSEREERFTQLREAGVSPELDLLKASSEALLNATQVQTSGKLAAKLNLEGQTQSYERRAALHRMQQGIERFESDRRVLEATLDRLDNEIRRRQIRSPATGRLGEVLPIRPGAVLQEGEKLAAVVVPGTARVIADFVAASAIGRLQPGQHARMRLDGFPWAEYGVLDAAVKTVGSESVDGRVRVELDVTALPSRIPIHHGMTGTVEVELERVSPINLLLRTLGEAWSARERPQP